jgi:hypothetical protein
MSETRVTGSAADRRRTRGAALFAAHPRWHGIRHPELIAPPPVRFSQLDMLPVVEAERLRRLLPHDAHGRRAERNRQIVAAHPRWRGIVHPERLVFPEPITEAEIRQAYRSAVRRARERLDESQRVCASVCAVADRLDHRRWPWGASPAELPVPPATPDEPRPGGLRLPRVLRSRRPTRALPRPAPRVLPH